MVILGTDFSRTSPRFINGLPAIAAVPNVRVAWRFPLTTLGFISTDPKSCAAINTQGMPLSIMVTGVPSMTSLWLPVGNNAPQPILLYQKRQSEWVQRDLGHHQSWPRLHGHLPIWCLNTRLRNLACVFHINPYRRFIALYRHHAPFDGKRQHRPRCCRSFVHH